MSLPRSSRPEAPAASSSAAPVPPPSTSSSTPLKPDPSNTVPFKWSCKCTNVILHGRINKEYQEIISSPKSGQPSGPLTPAWIDRTGEDHRMLEYMSFEGPGETRGRERMPSGETKGTWRRCLICNIKVYKVPGLHTRDGHSTRGLWVEVDLSDIYYGPSLEELLNEPVRPFSKLRFPLPSTPTTFRRLPGAQPITNYYPNPFITGTLAHMDLLPYHRDVFMGAPRAPPPHKFLHNMCVEAERFTADRYHEIHKDMLDDINEVIAKHTERYLKIEDTVRAELEILYNTFIETNAEAREPSTSKRRGSVLGKAKSRSASREPVQRKFSPPPKGHPSIQSVISEPVPKLKLKISWNEDTSDLPEADDDDKPVPPPFAGSLLTKSLSAHHQQAPAPPIEPPLEYPEQLVGQELEQIRQVSKTKDEREISMSYAFSALDEQMARRPPKDGPDAIQRAQAGELPHRPVSKKRMEETVGKSLSTIIPENQEGSSSEEGDSPNRSLSSERMEETVGKNLSFAIPEDQEESSSEESGSPPKPDAPDDGDVFEFEMEDEQAGPSMATSISLAKTDEYAGHAPSHRNAWKDLGDGKVRWNENKDIYDTRARNRNTGDNDDESKKLAYLGKSMPIFNRQPLSPIGGYSPADLEPKTSLSEREGYLVPPLRTASKKSVRIQSPIPEPSDQEEDVQPGVTGRTGFKPPHIQVREEEKARMKAAGGSRSIYDK